MQLTALQGIRHDTSLSVVKSLPPVLAQYKKEAPQEMTYECSTDMQYLRQYFFIREYAYRLDLGLKNFSGLEDAVDQYSHFIIARKGHFCVGGGRLTVSTRDTPLKLPMEFEDFSLPRALPELDGENYCELGRTAILPEYRTGDCLDNIFRVAAETAHQFGCKYMVGVSPPPVARRFRKAFSDLGYETTIRSDITPPLKPIHEHLSLKFLLGKLY